MEINWFVEIAIVFVFGFLFIYGMYIYNTKFKQKKCPYKKSIKCMVKDEKDCHNCYYYKTQNR